MSDKKILKRLIKRKKIKKFFFLKNRHFLLYSFEFLHFLIFQTQYIQQHPTPSNTTIWNQIPIPSLSIRAFCTKPSETMADRAIQIQNPNSISYLMQREAAKIDEILMGPLGFSVDQLMVKRNHSLIHNPILLCLFVVFTFSI